jgi:hypothetical protein
LQNQYPVPAGLSSINQRFPPLLLERQFSDGDMNCFLSGRQEEKIEAVQRFELQWRACKQCFAVPTRRSRLDTISLHKNGAFSVCKRAAMFHLPHLS